LRVAKWLAWLWRSSQVIVNEPLRAVIVRENQLCVIPETDGEPDAGWLAGAT
jgi:hypothetical protein